MAKKNTLRLELSGFTELLGKLDKLGGDLKSVTEDALNQAGETIAEDTVAAVQKTNLPAKGEYSKGKTEKSIVRNPRTEWGGMTASIGVGFDYSKPGAGGLLITGTPRMRPVRPLNDIYKKKKYMKQIELDMSDVISDAIEQAMGG